MYKIETLINKEACRNIMMGLDSEEDFFFNIAIVGLTALILIAAMSQGIVMFGIIMLSATVIVPAVVKYKLDSQHEVSNTSDPISDLQSRFANGDISHDEFESKLNAILESQEAADEAKIETEKLEL